MSTLAGTALLTRLDLRRDRVLASVWIAVLLVMLYASAAATTGLYTTVGDRVRTAEAINASPAIVALYGPVLDVTSLGELAMAKMTVTYAVLVAVLFSVMVRRHTRVEEERGQTELVAGTAVGRDAPLVAAVTAAILISLVLGLLTALTNTAAGLDPVGSVAFGICWAGTGLVATGVGAVAAQLSASARAAGAWAGGLIGAMFLLRAVGDTGPGWLSWLSPFGWNTQLRAYSGPRWWVALLYPGLAVALVGTAQLLRGRRDLGSGLIAPRPGPPVGSPRLAGALTLAVRVHGAALVTWTVAVGAIGILFGMMAPDLQDLMIDSASMEEVIDRLGGLLIAAVLSVVAVIVSCFAISVIAHTGKDEADGRTAMVLTTATSRGRWLLASLLVALLGSGWLLLVTGATLWIGYVAAGGPHIGNLVAAAVVWAPAVWVVAGLAAVSLALGARWSMLGWGWPVAFLTLALLGELLEWPSWAVHLSPYSDVPQVPAESFSWAPELRLVGVALALFALAWWQFHNRDID